MAGAASATAENNKEERTLLATTGASIRSVDLMRQGILLLSKCITLLAFSPALAAWWSIRLARADAAFRQRTPAEVARAIELEPENGEYLAALALQAEYSGQDSTPLLEEIARLNPRSSAPRIRLGLAAELRGDTNTAERWLKEAFSVDRQFETRWTLANFYFRQGQPDEFWTWMKSALEMSYGDRVAAFDLCWQRRRTTGRDSRPGHSGSPRSGGFVFGLRPESPSPGGDRRCGASPRKNSHSRRSAAALRRDRCVPGCRADRRAASVAGSRKSPARRNHSSEFRGAAHRPWIRLDLCRNARSDSPRLSTSPGHRIRFNGQQPESCELLRQVVAGLRPGAAYTLHWESRTQGMASPTGLTWRIDKQRGRGRRQRRLVHRADGLHARFRSRRAGAGLSPARGQVRTEGSVDLRQVLTSSAE